MIALARFAVLYIWLILRYAIPITIINPYYSQQLYYSVNILISVTQKRNI